MAADLPRAETQRAKDRSIAPALDAESIGNAQWQKEMMLRRPKATEDPKWCR